MKNKVVIIWILAVAFVLACVAAITLNAFYQSATEQVESLQTTKQVLENKIETLESEKAELEDEIQELKDDQLGKRIDQANETLENIDINDTLEQLQEMTNAE